MFLRIEDRFSKKENIFINVQKHSDHQYSYHFNFLPDIRQFSSNEPNCKKEFRNLIKKLSEVIGIHRVKCKLTSLTFSISSSNIDGILNKINFLISQYYIHRSKTFYENINIDLNIYIIPVKEKHKI